MDHISYSDSLYLHTYTSIYIFNPLVSARENAFPHDSKLFSNGHWRLSFGFWDQFPGENDEDEGEEGEHEEGELVDQILKLEVELEVPEKLTLIGRKVRPTSQLAIQLLLADTAEALPLEAESNSSDVKNHGIGPGPKANVTTNIRMKSTFT